MLGKPQEPKKKKKQQYKINTNKQSNVPILLGNIQNVEALIRDKPAAF